jgi:putative phosphoribosyl transferase
MRFQDRREAGRALAQQLGEYVDQPGVMVLALPRGGVLVGAEVARALRAPLDALLVRKLGVSGHEELAMGAVAMGATGGVRVLNALVIQRLRISEHVLDEACRREQSELQRRMRAYRDDLPPTDIRGRTVILVDDGIATGATMRAAIDAVRQLGAARIVVAVPVASLRASEALLAEVAHFVCLSMPEPFDSVGASYEDFAPVSDDDVRAQLRHARHGLRSLIHAR